MVGRATLRISGASQILLDFYCIGVVKIFGDQRRSPGEKTTRVLCNIISFYISMQVHSNCQSIFSFFFIQPEKTDRIDLGLPKPVFANLSRSPGIDSQPGKIDSSESIPELIQLLQIRAQHSFFGDICTYSTHYLLPITVQVTYLRFIRTCLPQYRQCTITLAIIILRTEQLITYGHNLYSFKIMKARDLHKPLFVI